MSNSISSVSDSSNNGEQDALEVQAAVPEVVTPEPRPISAATDPFDPVNLSRLRLSQDFTASAEVRRVITQVVVRKPSSQEFVRVRPGSDWRFEVACFIELSGMQKNVYIVDKSLWMSIPGGVKPMTLVLTISRTSPVPFLWPLNMPAADGRTNAWNESAIETARIAETQWVKLVSGEAAGMFVPHVALGVLAEPEWPADLTMADFLKLAFQGRIINDINHVCLRRLRGEI